MPDPCAYPETMTGLLVSLDLNGIGSPPLAQLDNRMGPKIKNIKIEANFNTCLFTPKLASGCGSILLLRRQLAVPLLHQFSLHISIL